MTDAVPTIAERVDRLTVAMCNLCAATSQGSVYMQRLAELFRSMGAGPRCRPSRGYRKHIRRMKAGGVAVARVESDPRIVVTWYTRRGAYPGFIARVR